MNYADLWVSIGGTVATGAAAAYYGPALKLGLDRRQAARELRTRYSPPLLGAAFDLQSRLYNIVRGSFLHRYLLNGTPEEKQYAEYSTLWLLGQYLGWVEILRLDVQFLDFGKGRRNRRLQEALSSVGSALADDTEPLLALFHAEQRAIGELMIVEPDAAGGRRTCLGYSDFCQRFDAGAFERWLARFRRELTESAEQEVFARMVRLQRALVDLVDVLDPDYSRYPEHDLRGKLPRPPDIESDAVPAEPRIARFSVEPSEHGFAHIWEPVLSWADKHELQAVEQYLETRDAVLATVLADKNSLSSLSYRWRGPGLGGRLSFTGVYEGGELSLYAGLKPPAWARRLGLKHEPWPLTSRAWPPARRARRQVDDLLATFDRPRLR